MTEYIERWALEWAFDAATMAFLEKEDNLFDIKSVLAGMSIASCIVNAVPAADVSPVVHGCWEVSDTPCERFECSECGGGCWYYDYQGDVAKSRYCPNCGAKMDKGEQKCAK